MSTSDWKEVARLEGHTDDTNCVHLHGYRHLLSGSDDYSVKVRARGRAHVRARRTGALTRLTTWHQVWDREECTCVATLAEHQARVWCVVSTESHIYSCGADKTVIVWSAADALRGVSTPIARFSGHVDVVYALQIAFGSLFSSSADKTIKRCAEMTPRP